MKGAGLVFQEWARKPLVKVAHPRSPTEPASSARASSTDWYSTQHEADAAKACCVPENPRGAAKEQSYDPNDRVRIPRKVLKGGSHLCAPSYCRRYRPAARHAEQVGTTTSHVDFRCIVRNAPSA